MPSKLASLISYVFHPLLMTTGLVAILYFFAPSVILPISDETIRPILIMIFVLTYIIPLVSIGMLRLTANISSFRLPEAKERFLPFIFVAVYYGLTTYLFYSKIVLGIAMILTFLCITITILSVAIISRRYKISAHAAGTAGLVAALLAVQSKYPDSQLFYPIIGSILLLGVVCSARLQLNEHSLTEVFWGTLLGLVVNFVPIFILT